MSSLLSNLGLRAKNILIALDQLIYVLITLGAGCPDETCSSAAWRAECNDKFFGFFRPIIDTMFFWENHHCFESYVKELSRKEFIKEYYSKLN